MRSENLKIYTNSERARTKRTYIRSAKALTALGNNIYQRRMAASVSFRPSINFQTDYRIEPGPVKNVARQGDTQTERELRFIVVSLHPSQSDNCTRSIHTHTQSRRNIYLFARIYFWWCARALIFLRVFLCICSSTYIYFWPSAWIDYLWYTEHTHKVAWRCSRARDAGEQRERDAFCTLLEI